MTVMAPTDRVMIDANEAAASMDATICIPCNQCALVCPHAAIRAKAYDESALAGAPPASSGRIIWGAGPVLLLPAATNNALGSEKFGIGPSAVVLTQPGPWTVGLLFNHIWSTSGANDREDVNTTFLQPFANYNLGGGLAVGAMMEAAANWNEDEEWTAPLLFTVSKVARLGRRPVNRADPVEGYTS